MAGLGKKVGFVALGIVALAVVLLYTTSFGKGLRDVWGSGAVQDEITKRHVNQTYTAVNSAENLKALGIGLRSYEASEGQYPDAAKWMDALSPRLVLSNLPKEQAEKKFVRPGVATGEYGYALNDAAAGKYHGDLPKGTILVFESAETGRNAHGDPKKDGRAGGSALTIEGNVVALVRS